MTTDRDIEERLVQTLRAQAEIIPDPPPLTGAGRARIRRSRAQRFGVLTALTVLGFGVVVFVAVQPGTDNAKITTAPTVETTPPPTSSPKVSNVETTPTTVPWDEQGTAIRAFKAHDRATSPYGPAANDEDYALQSDKTAITGNGTYTLTFRGLPDWFNWPQRPYALSLMSRPDAEFNAVMAGDIRQSVQDGQPVLMVDVAVTDFRSTMLDYTAWAY